MTINPYVQDEPLDLTLRRAFENVSACLTLWHKTHLPRDHRVRELTRAQEILWIILAQMRGDDDDQFNLIMNRILGKTVSDITAALGGRDVQFHDHARSFDWMAQSMRDDK